MVQRSKRFWGLLLVLVAVPCCLCGGCTMFLVGQFSGIRSTADRFMDLVQQGKFEEAYGMGGPIFQNAVSVDGMRTALAAYPALSPKASRSVRGSRAQFGGASFVSYTVANGPDSVVATVFFTKEGGRWKIHTLQLPPVKPAPK